MLNTRRVARELAILTMAQLSGRAERAGLSLEEMLGRAADMLAEEAQERVKAAASDLTAAEHRVHELYLGIAEEPLSKKEMETLLSAIEKAAEATELVGSALGLPAAVALADAPEVKRFVVTMIERYHGNREEVDRRLEEAAKNWSVERMASLDRDVLRLSIAELLHSTAEPVEVVINEAVSLAKKYGTPDSGRFVNGILARFAEEAAALRGSKQNVV